MSDPKDRGEEMPPANDTDPTNSPSEEFAQEEIQSEITREAARIRELTSEIAELKERYLRAAAETENVRKRAEREKNEVAQFAFQRFARDLLTVIDNFNRALDSVKPEARTSLPPAMGAVVEGIEATQRELLSIFERHGIKKIEAKGQRFNPNLHQAIAEMPSTEYAAGMVIDVAQTGYTLGERLLRPSMVMVSSGPGSAKNSAPGANVDTSA
ncbi:MAG: nucleotide exchange factor GrpE [Alphaproteobacteria bacterium]|nr:nucleotide exchange factor GrpE [Alphaproteobacteria bacterium]